MSIQRKLASLSGHIPGLPRSRPAKRTDRRWTPENLTAMEARVVPTTHALNPPAYDPGPDFNHRAVYLFDVRLERPSEDQLNFAITGGPPGRVITVSLYSSPGKPDETGLVPHDNLQAQKLQMTFTVVLDENGAGRVNINVADLVESGKLKLMGQRHFQIDFWDGEAPEKFSPKASLTSGSLLYGALFDYDTVKNDKPHR